MILDWVRDTEDEVKLSLKSLYSSSELAVGIDDNAFIRNSEPCQDSRYAEIPGIKLVWCFR